MEIRLVVGRPQLYLEHVGPACVAARENGSLRCVDTAGARIR